VWVVLGLAESPRGVAALPQCTARCSCHSCGLEGMQCTRLLFLDGNPGGVVGGKLGTGFVCAGVWFARLAGLPAALLCAAVFVLVACSVGITHEGLGRCPTNEVCVCVLEHMTKASIAMTTHTQHTGVGGDHVCV
jgi:hypothetical protein